MGLWGPLWGGRSYGNPMGLCGVEGVMGSYGVGGSPMGREGAAMGWSTPIGILWESYGAGGFCGNLMGPYGAGGGDGFLWG